MGWERIDYKSQFQREQKSWHICACLQKSSCSFRGEAFYFFADTRWDTTLVSEGARTTREECMRQNRERKCCYTRCLKWNRENLNQMLHVLSLVTKLREYYLNAIKSQIILFIFFIPLKIFLKRRATESARVKLCIHKARVQINFNTHQGHGIAFSVNLLAKYRIPYSKILK